MTVKHYGVRLIDGKWYLIKHDDTIRAPHSAMTIILHGKDWLPIYIGSDPIRAPEELRRGVVLYANNDEDQVSSQRIMGEIFEKAIYFE